MVTISDENILLNLDNSILTMSFLCTERRTKLEKDLIGTRIRIGDTTGKVISMDETTFKMQSESGVKEHTLTPARCRQLLAGLTTR